MRSVVIAVAALIASAATATQAAPASITVSVSPELQDKAVHDLGVRDVDQLAGDLKKSVERQLAHGSAFDGQRVVLELADVKPNHPTFKQMFDHPGLAYESFGIGGARVEGHAIAPDGHVTPLSYSYYEPDIRYARLGGTWADAEWAIDQFAHRLSHGPVLASR